MSNERSKLEPMPIVEATVSNMWEIAAIVKVFDWKRLRTKQDLHTIIDELRRKTPPTRIPEMVFPVPYLMTETGNAIIDDILNILNMNGLLGSLIQAGQAA
jgi:hypothetical protein